MKCDSCTKHIGLNPDDLQIRPHPENKHWHIHLCAQCGKAYDKGEPIFPPVQRGEMNPTPTELIAQTLRHHAAWSGNGETFTCTGCGLTTHDGWDATNDHKAEEVFKALVQAGYLG